MDYKKILKLIFIAFLVVTTIFTIIYYAAITRAENLPPQNQNSGIEGTNLDKVLNYIEDFFKKESENFAKTTTLAESKKQELELIQREKELAESNSQLNRKLLNECLAKVENEWEELEGHYENVLNNCIALDLGLNGGKLFSAGVCEDQITPFKDKDRSRIQEDKRECFDSYSERQ